MTDPVVDVIVRSIITQSIAQQASRPRETIIHRIRRAWLSLQTRRRELDPLNINLAAAEHYMYARFLAGVSGDPSVRMAPTLYGLKKRLFFAFGIQDKMATTANPVLPPNAAVERWGTTGANEGLLDYTNANGRAANNYGKAIISLASEARRYN